MTSHTECRAVLEDDQSYTKSTLGDHQFSSNESQKVLGIELYHPNIQCRIGLISEVIVIGSNSDQSNSEQHCDWHCQSYALVSSLFSQFYPLVFSQNIFALVVIRALNTPIMFL